MFDISSFSNTKGLSCDSQAMLATHSADFHLNNQQSYLQPQHFMTENLQTHNFSTPNFSINQNMAIDQNFMKNHACATIKSKLIVYVSKLL
jgi:hypothetical protein